MSFLDGLWPIAYFSGMYFAGIIKTNLGYMYNYGLGMLTRCELCCLSCGVSKLHLAIAFAGIEAVLSL